MKFLHKPDNAPFRREAARRRRRSTSRPQAMTLIELLVSVAILSIMILIFSSILVNSQKVVTVSQGVMHANAKAAAIAEIIRNDIKRITQNGFLCITEDDELRARLLFTTAGVSPSLTGDFVGSETLVSFGLCNNQGTDPTSTNPDDNVLWRQGWIQKVNSSAPGTGDDVRPILGIEKQPMSMDRGDMNPYVNNMLGSEPPDTGGMTYAIHVPPPIDRLQGLWQCVTTGCSQLSIMWTDGTPDGSDNLNWFGKDNPETVGALPAFDPANPQQREYQDGGRYRILWTRHNQNNWPTAIRIRFVLTDDSVPEELGDTELGETVYEVICPIGM